MVENYSCTMTFFFFFLLTHEDVQLGQEAAHICSRWSLIILGVSGKIAAGTQLKAISWNVELLFANILMFFFSFFLSFPPCADLRYAGHPVLAVVPDSLREENGSLRRILGKAALPLQIWCC